MMKSAIDTTVIFIFSAFVLIIGLLFARTGRNMKSFFAGGEAVPWFIGGLSLFMSFFSAGTFVAWGSIAYKYGFVSVTIQWTMCLGGIITAFLLAPRWKRTGALTAAEFIRQRLGAPVQKFYVNIFLLVSLFNKGAVLYPVAKLVSVSLGFPLTTCTIVLGLMMIAYTAIGGLWAVMVTDILQFVILTAAVLMVLPLSLDAAGGWTKFTQQVPADFFNVINGEYSIGFILAFALYHISYIGGNWTFVQRYTSVDSPKSAKKVAFLFAGLYLVSPVIWMLPPMIYRSIDPALTGLNTENAYLQVCRLVLPPGLMGLMLTGMYFSTSATANTTLNVTSAVITNDIYKALINPGASDRQLIRVARLSGLLLGIGMIGVALLVPAAGGMIEVVLSIAAITGGPSLLPPLWALFSKKLTGKAAYIISGASLLVNLLFKLLVPALTTLKLSRSEEMLLGVGLPFLLLLLYEFVIAPTTAAKEYQDYRIFRTRQQQDAAAQSAAEKEAIHKQNLFGLRVIAFSLAFTALLLYVLSILASSGNMLVAMIASAVLLAAIIPLRAVRKIRKQPEYMLQNNIPVEDSDVHHHLKNRESKNEAYDERTRQ
ncbi:sodium:solute symporter family protein [Chitinophaga pinensis]|uniref:Na+/solute symporter n=1 Tax=Chitinophaga pinensis (strain ATCC 43595 / DSM 2588 / LMG 13176 / NBRC 15968 / NCIMB 11800 / UQM 2034) TaxID=485918 RepID=A0A979G4Z5_CHIPD|nr:sodium:solute symporter family protein [Chitinophaga pinensis]ACU61005.1 Na+/solute symporter [Chitinophaga pinensis DSM 2588]